MTRLHKYKILASRKTKLVDKLTYIAAVVEPIFLYPQAYQIFHHKTAAGVSLPAWVGIDLLTAIWIWYAIAHKQKLIFIYQGLFFIANSLIIVGALKYGGKWF